MGRHAGVDIRPRRAVPVQDGATGSDDPDVTFAAAPDPCEGGAEIRRASFHGPPRGRLVQDAARVSDSPEIAGARTPQIPDRWKGPARGAGPGPSIPVRQRSC